MTVLEAISYIIEDRKKQNRMPQCAMKYDVKKVCKLSNNELDNELERLKKIDKIALKDTINSTSIYLIR